MGISWGYNGNVIGRSWEYNGICNQPYWQMGASENGLCSLQNSNVHGKNDDEPGNLRD